MEKLLAVLSQFKEKSTQEIKLDAVGSWCETRHVVEKKDILAMVAALGSQRALLLTGDPGVGKSHLARVAASITKRFFISTVIKPDDEIGDLLWKIDYTQRLSDAQLAGATKQVFDAPLKTYVRPGSIWYAFQQPGEGFTSEYQPVSQKAAHSDGVVLLIDEIDKASVALLNSLLEVLGNMSFDVPLTGDTIECRKNPPLIILTSNGDRALPAPLLRRCVCHEVSLPKSRAAFIQRMKQIAKAQMRQHYSEKVAESCADVIYTQRDSHHHYNPGASEFVDLLRTLQAIAPDDPEAQIETHLSAISRYFLKG